MIAIVAGLTRFFTTDFSITTGVSSITASSTVSSTSSTVSSTGSSISITATGSSSMAGVITTVGLASSNKYLLISSSFLQYLFYKYHLVQQLLLHILVLQILLSISFPVSSMLS